MSSKTDYTNEEWTTVLSAAYFSALLIIVSDLNVAFFKELAALSKAIMGSGAESESDLIKAIALDFSSKETQEEIKPELEKIQKQKDPQALKDSMLESITGAADLVKAKSAEDGKIYRNWLFYLAQKTAEGSKEGGFLGIGAVRISDREHSALDELALALGVTDE